MESNVKKNFIYQVLYQALISILPFVTSPYISRVIGADGIGVYSYTYSIAHYFVMFGNLGISLYGNRLIAKARNDKEEMNRAFSSLFALHLGIYLIVIIAYIFYVFLFSGDYQPYSWIQIMYLISGALDISWLFFGLEKFKFTVTRNSIIKILTACSVFIFVKDGSDLWKYVVIMAAGEFIGQTILWTFFKRYASFSKFELKEMLAHLKPLFTLFFATVAVSIYSYMDKIMIGAMSSTKELGYYENAWKMIEFPVGFITALGTVMLPRISNLQNGENEGKIKEYIYKSLRFSVLAAVAIMFGLLCISKDFAVVFWGENFGRSGTLMQIMSITVLLMAWNGVIRQEYLIPHQKDSTYLVAVCTAAVINLVINACLIPRFGAAGAAVATVISYFSIFLVQNFAARGKIGFKKVIVQSIPYAVIAVIMYVVVTIFSNTHDRNVVNLIIEVVIGVAVYCVCSFLWVLIKKDAAMAGMINSVIGKVNKKWQIKIK